MKKIVVIAGPTAVGKSALAVLLARCFNGEVISADSRQVYKGLDIGSGKITKKEMKGVAHHLLNVIHPQKQFTVAEFKNLAQENIDGIRTRGKLPIVVGGTGLYIDALLGEVLIPEVPPNQELRKQLEKKSTETLFVMLREIDPRRAQTIDRHNPRRLIRAIEIARTLGKVSPKPQTTNYSLPAALRIGLSLPAEDLKRRISIRLFARISRGMVSEVERLHQQGLSWKRLYELGLEYRYVSRYLRGLMTKDEMNEKLKTEIWHYAKRQMTWWKRDKRIKWFLPTEKTKIVATVKRFLLS